jgi:Tol biopolymer transport system component
MRGHYLRTNLSLLWMCLILITTGGCISLSSSTSANLSTFTNDGNIYDGGKWSPDGHWFAASIFPQEVLQWFSSHGKVIGSLSGCDLPGMGRNYTWLPDGRISCFTGNVPPVLQIIPLDQKGQVKGRTLISVPITPGTIVYDMQWNPHHFWLTTIAEAKPGGGVRSETLYLSDLDGHSLISPLSVSGGQLVWSPDGTTLAIVEQSGDVLLLTIQQTAPGKLAIVKTRRLAAGTDYLQNVAWSPSGRWLVCRHVSYESEDYLFLLATDGSGKQVKLTSSTSDGQLDYPAWSPDGKQLIMSRVSDGVLLSLDIATLLKQKGVKP